MDILNHKKYKAYFLVSLIFMVCMGIYSSLIQYFDHSLPSMGNNFLLPNIITIVTVDEKKVITILHFLKIKLNLYMYDHQKC